MNDLISRWDSSAVKTDRAVKPKTDVLLSEEEMNSPPSGEHFTFGDAVKTPDGKVAIMSGSGSMGTERVRLHFPDGSSQWEDKGVLSKADESEYPKGFEKHRDEFGNHSWKPKSISKLEWDVLLEATRDLSNEPKPCHE